MLCKHACQGIWQSCLKVMDEAMGKMRWISIPLGKQKVKWKVMMLKLKYACTIGKTYVTIGLLLCVNIEVISSTKWLLTSYHVLIAQICQGVSERRNFIEHVILMKLMNTFCNLSVYLFGFLFSVMIFQCQLFQVFHTFQCTHDL